jgi:peptidoglycan hydrolase-like protein with peptidoglycan-binding domain
MNALPQDKPTAAVVTPAVAPTAPAPTQIASVQPSPAIAPQDNAAPVATATENAASLTPAQKLAAQMGTLPPGATPAGVAPTTVANTDASSDPGDDAGSTDPALITKIQRGLASLGFLAQKIDGVPGEGTAKAIRNFEVFYDYKVTGLATPQLVNLLVQHGAQI